MSKDMNLIYIGPFGIASGYGSAATDYIAALHKAGVHLRILPPKPLDQLEVAPRYAHLKQFVGPEKNDTQGRNGTHYLVHGIPEACSRIGRELPEVGPNGRVKTVALTTWETDKLPAEYAEGLNRYDAVVVLSEFNRRVFENTCLKGKVHVVPHCCDPDWWWKKPRTNVADSAAPYSFLAILTWSEQKNPLGLLKAYLTEFTSKDNVTLRILTPSWNKGEVTRLVQNLGLYDPPEVVFWKDIHGRLNDEAMRDLHLSSDCYVSLSRGEGFGLGAFEAMLSGSAVIATDWSGHTDFLRGGPSVFLVPYQLTPAFVPETISDTVVEGPGGVKLRPVLVNAPTGISADQNWAEPDLMAARRAMRKCYEEKLPRGVPRDHGDLGERLSHATIGKQFKTILENL